MYDKVKLWIDRTDIASDYGVIPGYLDKATDKTDSETGEWLKTDGTIGGLRVAIHQTGLSVEGSISKYFYGNNVYTLNRHTTKEALDRLGSSLHIDMSIAKVLSFEFGTVLSLRNDIPGYLSLFGDMPRRERLSIARGTLHYIPTARQKAPTPSHTNRRTTKQSKVYAFYDKIAEMKNKGAEVPPGFENKHLLKYEIRFNRRVANQFRMREIRASALTDKQFYRRLLTMWKDDYFTINKQRQMKTDYIKQIHTPGEACKAFTARLMALSQMDSESQIEAFISELKASGAFSNRNDYTRTRKALHDIMGMAGVTETDALIHELDNEVRNIAAYT